MDRSVIEAHILEALTHAMDHARQGRVHLERQRQIIKRLERGGHDTAMAISLLHALEEAQALHEQSVTNLEDELVAFHSEPSLSEQSPQGNVASRGRAKRGAGASGQFGTEDRGKPVTARQAAREALGYVD